MTSRLTNSGVTAIYKPLGKTSHWVINQVRKLTGEKRVGHAGTLDPLAEGVLVVAIGREHTKQLASHVESQKEYLAEIKLGINSTTDDEEGAKTEIKVVKIPTESEIKKVLKKFIGEIDQIPPIYSAIKIKGQPAHRRVRRGQKIELNSRKVVIDDIEMVNYQWPLLSIKVVCQKGVYIRSLARDIGEQLKTGGYLTKLVRTRVGQFRIEQAIKLDSRFRGNDR